MNSDINNSDIKEKQVTLILGNGFDINMGLKTSYYDFVKWYIGLDCNDNKSIKKLKEHIDIEEMKWCDLELKLGEYTKFYDNYVDFYDAYCDIGEKLICYLVNEENVFIEKTDLKKTYVSQKFIEDIMVFLANNRILSGKKILINFITFNYTIILDKLVDIIKTNKELKSFFTDQNIELGTITHCHGKLCDNKICFGVDNYGQIKNQGIFTGDESYMQQMVKPLRNEYLDNVDLVLSKKAIMSADVIVVYGSSLGESDEYWKNYIKYFFGGIKMHNVFNGNSFDYSTNKETYQEKRLYYYSHKKKPVSLFDANSIEFENIIRNNISFKNDKRIIIIYDNVFANLNDIMKEN